MYLDVKMGEDIEPRIKHPSRIREQELVFGNVVYDWWNGGEKREERKIFGITLIQEETNKFS